MGEVIRRDAAAADILADVRATLTGASARGGDIKSSAEARLASTLTLADGISQRLQTASAALAPALAALETEDAAADALIGRISDEIWNLVGRPANDAALDILFPGGIAYYADGQVAEQPERMELLSQLLDSGVHPRLPSERAKAMASELHSSAAALRERVAAVTPLRTQVTLAQRMHVALGRSAHAALASLKRQWKADGHSEAEIHAIIPDRPASKKAGAQIPTP